MVKHFLFLLTFTYQTQVMACKRLPNVYELKSLPKNLLLKGQYIQLKSDFPLVFEDYDPLEIRKRDKGFFLYELVRPKNLLGKKTYYFKIHQANNKDKKSRVELSFSPRMRTKSCSGGGKTVIP